MGTHQIKFLTESLIEQNFILVFSFRCDECNLTFRTEKSLARHRELHDPTRPLACGRCPLRYKNKDQLVRHVQTHEKPDITCELCHRVFGRPDHLKRHIATKHSSLSATDQQSLSENLIHRFIKIYASKT